MTLVKQYFGRTIPSQDPSIASPSQRIFAEKEYLPLLVEIWRYVEAATGYAWHATSFWRDSPSHHKGCALDIAPDIADSSKKYYAVYRRSDPVLYKREKLMKALQQAVSMFHNNKYSLGVYVEPDHLHMQVHPYEDANGKARLFKWGVPKLCYPDSFQRSKLPLITVSDAVSMRRNLSK